MDLMLKIAQKEKLEPKKAKMNPDDIAEYY